MFEEIDFLKIPVEVFNLIGKRWMLITAGDFENHNSMTASWGGFGVLWHKPVVSLYVRPQRYTKKFLDKEDLFTISFYEDRFKNELSFFGTNSGKDVNKDEKTNFKPKNFFNATSYEQASLVFVCKKLYCNQLNPDGILNPEIKTNFYKQKDYSFLYVGEILKAFSKKTSQLF